MSEQVIQCPGCGVKLKMKGDRILPDDAACPKCQCRLSQKKLPPGDSKASILTRSSPAATPVRTSQTNSRRPVNEAFDDEELEDDFEEDRPRKRSRQNGNSAGGVPSWLIGAGIGAIFVGVIIGAVILIPRGGAHTVAHTPAGTVTAAPTTAASSAVQPISDSGNINTQSMATLPTGQTVTSDQVAPAATQYVSPPSAATPAPVAPPVGAAPLAKYHPQAGSKHSYHFEVTSDFGQYKEKSSGVCVLTTEQAATTEGFSIRPEHREGSGSGFVVGSNGVIVTCAHVVDEAESIQVTIDGKTYPATVLHSDSSLDLAVIKIEANGLQALPLANSDQLQLGQPLRVIGFPLSDVLGTGIKVTQGAVSGIVEKDGKRHIQTDATINPGNSGGPVFNTRGEVVGIASAKLSGAAVSQVGFCVPSTTLSGMLLEKGIVLAPLIAGHEMETPVMVQKVSPSVAFLKVTLGSEIHAQIGIRYLATMSVFRESQGGRPFIGGHIRPVSDIGRLALSELGQPVKMSDGEYAPIIMTRLPLLPFVEFNKSRQTDWTNQRDITIVREDRSNSRFGARRGLYNDLFPGQEPKVVAVQKAVETDKYHVDSNNSEKLTLSRTYELKTTDGSEPGIHLTGAGTWAFDHAQGMPLGSDLKGTFKVTVAGTTITIPYTVKVSRFTQAEIDQQNEALAAAAANKTGDADKDEPAPGSDATHVVTTTSFGFKTLAISPNGKTCAFTEQDKILFVHDLASGKEIDSKAALNDLGAPSQSTYSPDGKFLLVGGYKGIIRIWSIDEKGEVDKFGDFVGHTGEIQAIEVLPDNKTVISSDAKKRVSVWSLEDQKEKYNIADLKDVTIEIGASPDGKSGMLVATNSNVSMFHLADGKVTTTNPVFKSHFGKVALFSPDGKTLFIPDSYRVTGHTIKSKKSPDIVDLGEIPWTLAYCPQTNEVIAGGSGKIHIIDMKKETRTGILSTGSKITGNIKNVAISSDGRYIAAIAGPIGQSVLIFDRQASKADTADTADPEKNSEIPPGSTPN